MIPPRRNRHLAPVDQEKGRVNRLNSPLRSRLELRPSRTALVKDTPTSASNRLDLDGQQPHARTREVGRKIASGVTPADREQRTCGRYVSRWAVLGAILLGLLVPAANAASAQAAGPAWRLSVTPSADYFTPGNANRTDAYTIELENVGGEPTSGPVTLQDVLPSGIDAGGVLLEYSPAPGTDLAETLCPTSLRCVFPGALQPGEKLAMVVKVSISAHAAGARTDLARVSGGGPSAAEASGSNQVDADPPFGFTSFIAPLVDSSRTTPFTAAGGHPFQLVTEMEFATESDREECEEQGPEKICKPANATVRDPRDVAAQLPPGLIGDPGAVHRCSLADFYAKECPLSTVLGDVGVRYGGQVYGGLREIGPLYNLVPFGEFPGALGFESAFPLLFKAAVRSGSDYGLTVTSEGTPMASIDRVRVVTWGVPAEAAHDGLRGKTCLGLESGGALLQRGPLNNDETAEEYESNCEREPGHQGETGGPAGVAHPHPYLTMPTECSVRELGFTARFDTWQLAPSEEASASAADPAVTGCDALAGLFAPQIEARPTTDLADAPSGLEFKLTVPQHEECTEPPSVSCEPATPELREAVVKLPPGLTVNPSSGNGLTACSPEQIGLTTPVGEAAHFTEEPARCPDASKIGTAEVDTSLLNEPLKGSVYLATPHQNPFDSLLAGYIVLEGQGLVIKLPGRIEADPSTGRITGSFAENPPLPFDDFKLTFFGGAKGDLRTPAVCGSYETTSTLTPWSAPESGPPAEPTSGFEITGGGAACPRSAGGLPNAPAFHAGTESPEAGHYTPFSLRLSREDGSQEFERIETTLPPGLSGKLAGVAECSQAQLAVAASREHEGGGAEEQASPACPSSSEVGTVQVGAGAGPTPLYVTGKAYLAGPYEGAPLSLAIITPAIAGPFDLGDVLVRTALFVDPLTARIKAVSDPVPHILDGIPLDVRSITLKMDRPDFTLNPTDCEELHLEGAETSVTGAVAPLSQRFQVGNCAALPFKPRLKISLKGSTKHAGHPGLRAVLTYPKGGPYANVARAQVNLPHSEFIDQGNLNKTCTRPVLLEGACPAKSIYGKAKAWTPLLEAPLEGPVYLVGGFGYKLPALVAELDGQIRVLLVGKVDSGKNKGIRNTFEAVPDAPVEKFELRMKGGKRYSLLENSEDLCARPQKAIASFTAQSGRVLHLHPKVANECGKKHRRHGRHGKHHGAHGKSGKRHARAGSASGALAALLSRGW